MRVLAIQNELDRRYKIGALIDYAFESNFIEANKSYKLRRNEVYGTILKTLGMERSLGSHQVANIIFEILSKRGVTKGKTDGVRYFRGLTWKTNSTIL